MFRDPLLEELLGLDLEVFELDERRVWGLSSETGENLEAFSVSTLVHEPSRGLGKEHDSNAEDDGGKDLNGDGHKPGSSALRVAGTSNVVGAWTGQLASNR